MRVDWDELVQIGRPDRPAWNRMRREIARIIGETQTRAVLRQTRRRWMWLLHAWLTCPWKAETLLDVVTWGTFARKPTAAERRAARERVEAIRKGRIEPWKERRRREHLNRMCRLAAEKRREMKLAAQQVTLTKESTKE